ncbi:hypothetical protein [Pseudomonas alabamensis]|uniref:hypothetical protein n=1 Tax=Pseudomonas alabamensis TaxID=3064349 RepID=UPI003F64E8C6
MPRHVYAPGRGLEETEARIDVLTGAAREDGNMLDSISGSTVSTIKEAVADANKLPPDRTARLLDHHWWLVQGHAFWYVFACGLELQRIEAGNHQCG